MDGKRSLYGQNGSGIPKIGMRPSAYSGLDSGIPKPASRSTLGPGLVRQSSGYGQSRPSTFGPLSAVKSGASSVRKSFYPSARKSRTPQTSRPSFNPSSGQSTASRQSLGAQRTIQEDRPIGEPSYHKQCVSKLNDFLQRIGHPTLQPRFSISPSSSDIRRAFEVLFHELGINLTQAAAPPKTWDQEVPPIMRSLGYKHTINKKFALSSTSNHSKGQLFGMFEWLVDAVSYHSRSGVQQVLYQGALEAPDLSLELFKVALCSDDAQRQDMLNQIGDAIYGTEEQRQAMIVEQESLQKEISALDREISQVEEMRNLHSQLEKECSSFEKYAQEIAKQLEEHRNTAAQELPVINKKISEAEAQICSLNCERDRIASLLAEQEFGQEDLKWARERQHQLKEEVDRESKAIEELKRDLRDVRLTVKQDEDKLMKMQSDIHSLLMSLKEAVLSPTVAPYVTQIKDLLQSKRLEAAFDFLIRPISFEPNAEDKRLQLQQLVQEYKMQLVQQTVVLDGNVMTSSQQKIKDLETAIDEKEKTVRELKEKMASLNQEIESDRMDATQEHNRLKKEYENNQTFLKELGEKLRKSEAETTARVQKLLHEVTGEETELMNLKKSRFHWIQRYTCEQRDILAQIVKKAEECGINLKSHKESLEEERMRQKAKIDKLRKQISSYKASKPPKK